MIGGNGDLPVDRLTLRRMLASIKHRGPDQFGVYLYEGTERWLGLGSARLSIIDLNHGQQPIRNEDGTLWIVFNGEVFNYLRLRKRLVEQGHSFATASDTEVVLHLFEEYGPECVTHMNGQFALAIWNEREETLFLARDRCGVRPLYYAERASTLVFASEIKAILASGAIGAELDPVAIDQAFTYWSTLTPRTAFRGIRSLPPGHWMVVDSSGSVRCEEYWRLSFPAAGMEESLDMEDASGELRDLLVDATSLRLRSDVPVGAYLSGGLDSSCVAAIAQQVAGSRLETFSIAFADEQFDESSFQTEMARFLGTNHHLIRCTGNDIGRVFPEVVWHAEAPLLRTAPAPMYLLSELVHDLGFKVVLTGEGADEFLAGYDVFKEAKIRRFWARQASSTARPMLLRRLYPYIASLSATNGAYAQKFFGQSLGETCRPSYSHDPRWRTTARTKRLFSDSLRSAVARCRTPGEDDPACDVTLPEEFGAFGALAQAQYIEATVFLPEYLLSSQGDRMAMAHSVEGRFPFLDHRLIEFCNRLAPRAKLSGLDEKHVLKRAVRDLVPEGICNRPKQPYRAPICGAFFPEGKPLDWVAEALSSRALDAAGCFDSRAVDMLAKKAQRSGFLGETDEMALAGVLSTQLVHRRFIAEFPSVTPLSDETVKTVCRNRDSRRGALLS